MRVQLFGGIEVAVDDGGAATIGAAKPRWLLAFLALSVGRSRSVDSIIDALWHDRPPQSAPNLVQGYISDLRKVIGHASIRTTENGYLLAIDDDAVDVVRFRQLTHAASLVSTSEPERARLLLDDACSIAVGIPFGDAAPDGPLAASAVLLSEQVIDAAELRARLMLDLGDHREAIVVLDELTRQHPYREGLWAALALALYRSDRQVDALRRLADARRVPLDDLGVSPGPTLVELERQILEHSPLLRSPATPGAKFSDQPTIVGRADELARLRNRLGQAAAGAQRTVFVGGEPGIGKTTLAREVARAAVGDHSVVLTGRCDEHVAVPYRPFVEAITDHLRAIGGHAASELLEERWPSVVQVIPSLQALRPGVTVEAANPQMADISLLERFDTFCWILGRIRGDRCLLLILEDLHWADSATLRLTHFLAAGHRLPRCLTIGTHRTTEPTELLGDILADLRTEPDVERMSLGGLAERDLVLLMSGDDIGNNDELAGWIYRETDGNPFLAVEIIDHIARTGTRDGVPVGVTEVVSRRLRRLSPGTQLLLEYAAVLGEAGPISLLRQFAGIVPDVPAALAEAVQAGILAEEELDEPRYRFAHAIIRTAVTTGMTGLHLQDLNVAAAEAWAALSPSQDVTVAVASHYLAAGPAASPEASIEAFIDAGDASDRTGAKVEAVQWYDHALERLADDDPRRGSLRLRKFVAAQTAWHWLHGDYAGSGSS